MLSGATIGLLIIGFRNTRKVRPHSQESAAHCSPASQPAVIHSQSNTVRRFLPQHTGAEIRSDMEKAHNAQSRHMNLTLLLGASGPFDLQSTAKRLQLWMVCDCISASDTDFIWRSPSHAARPKQRAPFSAAHTPLGKNIAAAGQLTVFPLEFACQVTRHPITQTHKQAYIGLTPAWFRSQMCSLPVAENPSSWDGFAVGTENLEQTGESQSSGETALRVGDPPAEVRKINTLPPVSPSAHQSSCTARRRGLCSVTFLLASTARGDAGTAMTSTHFLFSPDTNTHRPAKEMSELGRHDDGFVCHACLIFLMSSFAFGNIYHGRQ
eukprot:TRINITY_DN10088_c0_g1_i1.p1 TRINITY_DN10088_c0_g1~~TRINITY_DN10088_c0_g1_i1.p1  ORF type:complete len:324 (-),score=-59.83 TRINITY_DN10088_c0_g1_i1:580-1551(-)